MNEKGSYFVNELRVIIRGVARSNEDSLNAIRSRAERHNIILTLLSHNNLVLIE